ncbi:MAG: hypothetical protein IJV41_07400 [Oscillospiraceae bacterium]|nr:hypothetical protein [Oscillospiraceae bacterium]
MLSKEILFAMNDIRDEYLEDARQSILPREGKHVKKTARRVTRTLLIAAIISVLMVGTAFAAGVFSLRERRPADADETYTLHWSESPSESLTWTDIKYVFTFDGPEECSRVKFKPGWLPFEPVYSTPDADGYYTRLVSEGAPGVDHTSSNYQPYMVNAYYVPQFATEDGAMLLMYQTPGEITEEHWGSETVLKFTASKHFDAIERDDRTIPERTDHYYFVIRFSESDGYIVVTCGTSDMETVEHVARELDIQPTGEIVKTSDYENHVTFIDVGQG